MTRDEWLKWRLKGIGASDAPIIMGKSPWKTIDQLWEEKVTGIDNYKDNPSMARGRELEDTARALFSKLQDVEVFPKNIIHPEWKFLRASLDGMTIERDLIVEIKCPNKKDHKEALDGKAPEKYYPQCQHQLLVTGLPKMYYFSYSPSFKEQEGACVEVLADDEYIEDMRTAEKHFWCAVINKIKPSELPLALYLSFDPCAYEGL